MIHLRGYTPAEGWGTAETIPTDVVSLQKRPQLAIDPNGKALLVWYQETSPNRNIWSSRFELSPGCASMAATSSRTPLPPICYARIVS